MFSIFLALAAAQTPGLNEAEASGPAREPGAAEPEASGPAEAARRGGDPGDAPAPSFVLDMPLSVDGDYVRDVAVGVGADGSAFLREDQLLGILSEVAKASFLTEVGLTEEERLTALSVLRSRGLDIAYDQANLAVVAALRKEDRLPLTLSLGRRQGEPDSEDALQPASFSAGVNLRMSPSYVHEGDETGFAPFAARAEGFVNAGGFGGATLLYDAQFREDANDPLVLNDVVAFKDFFESAIRVSGGTLRTPVTGRFTGSQSLVGLGLSRDFDEIRPFENLLPAGATAFELERDALVTVLVNGAAVVTERFRAGVYDVADLPLTGGGNDVTVIVEEDGLSREVAVFTTYVDAALLRGGLSRFGVFGGVVREPGGALPQTSDTVAASASYERGVTDQFTIAGALQSLDEDFQVAARGVVGTRLGVVAAEAAYQEDIQGPAHAAALRWTWQSDPSNQTSHQIDAQLSYESEGFSTLAVRPRRIGPPRPEPRSTAVAVRYGLRRGRFSANLSGRFAEVGTVRTTGAVLGVSYAFGAATAAVNARASWREADGVTDHETAVLFSLTHRLGRRGRVRTSYDTDDRASEAQLLKLGTPFLGEWDGRLLIRDEEDAERLDADLGYVANRAELAASHTTSRTDGATRSVTTARVGVGIGLAAGQVAFGRPFASGFAIVSPHESLGDRQVTLTRGEDLIEARTGALGPALQPLRSPYRLETARVQVEDLPIGYDLGPDTLEFFPPARAGYVHTVGKGASNTLMSVLVQPDGTPMALAIGSLIRSEGQDASSEGEGEGEDGDKQVQFFTNRTGRFVAEGLRPGRYDVLMKPDDRKVAEVEIPGSADGLVRLEAVRMERK